MSSPQPKTLSRELGTLQATALNVANMVGIGPFVTIPLFVAAMGGPQAIVGWIVGGILVVCDGLVWSELGAALPGSGGSYHFLREIFGRYRFGRLMPFLFIWQFMISGSLEVASGYIGAMNYVQYAAPGLFDAIADQLARWNIHAEDPVAIAKGIVAAVCVLLVAITLCRPVRFLGWLGVVLCAGTIVTVSIIIVAGVVHFDASLFVMPKDAWKLDGKFVFGLGAAMRIAVYDYFGYYNICHLGDEVREPGKTIPRAVMMSVLLVATIYMTMNISILGVVPWQEVVKSQDVAAIFMERLYGRPIAVAFTWLVIWTAAASVFAATLGFSRIPFAAAQRGDFFPIFGQLHATRQYPVVSLWSLSALIAGFCFLNLDTLVNAAVVVRLGVQFIGQIVGLHLLRRNRPDVVLPFKMWLYPLPSLLALAGWLFLIVTAEEKHRNLAWQVFLAGIVVYGAREAWRAWQSRQKPHNR